MMQVLEFVERRLEVLLTDSGAQPELVRAVLRQRAGNPALAAASVRELQVCTAACIPGRRLRAHRGLKENHDGISQHQGIWRPLSSTLNMFTFV